MNSDEIAKPTKQPANKKPLKRGSATTDCRGSGINPTSCAMSPTGYRTAKTPRKAGAEVYVRTIARVNPTPSNSKARMKRALLFNWYREGDSNPYSLWPLPPQGSVSTNSTTSAINALTSALELEVRRRRQTLAFALRAPVHLQLPVFSAALPARLDQANRPDSVRELFL